MFTTFLCTSLISFNPHTHTGCDLSEDNQVLVILCFNPHTHTGCDKTLSPISICFKVSIHTPIQGVTGHHQGSKAGATFQSTHPYRVWRLQGAANGGAFVVSIHTPIQGVTDKAMSTLDEIIVSIHTPIQGVTEHHPLHWTSLRVSIHTPIQGVTDQIVSAAIGNMFQSTHPYRVWPMHVAIGIRSLLFQSTHPYRVWHQHLDHTDAESLFQSTHPYRVWPCSLYHLNDVARVSIHTPIQGVTL